MIEPLFGVSAIPGDVASGIGAAILAAGTAMWRRITVLSDQNRTDNAAHNFATSQMYELALAKKDAELDYLRKKAL